MNQYETVFILTPVLSEVQVKESVEKYAAIITELGGEVVSKDIWGLRKLAYPIQKKNTGFYQMLDFKCEGAAIEKIEIALKRDERVLRFLTVKMDKFHAAYATKRRNKVNENA